MITPDNLTSPTVLRDHVDALSVALAWWADRDEAVDKEAARRAADRAMRDLDAVRAELVRIRFWLAEQVREWDEVRAAGTAT